MSLLLLFAGGVVVAASPATGETQVFVPARPRVGVVGGHPRTARVSARPRVGVVGGHPRTAHVPVRPRSEPV